MRLLFLDFWPLTQKYPPILLRFYFDLHTPTYFTVGNIKNIRTENVRFLYKRLSDAANKARYFYVKRKIQNYLLRIHEF